MAVWTSTLFSDRDSVQKAVSCDVSFTHPSKIVHDAILVYQSAIHILLNNPDGGDRVDKAMAHAIKIASGAYLEEKENCSKWLEDAQSLSNSADKLQSDANFLNEVYNTRNRQGWLKHAFVLSFYHLLRFKKVD